MIRKCEVCEKEMQLRIVGKKGSKRYGEIIVVDKNKRFCSVECQNKWQQSISWEERVGEEAAERIRRETSDRVSGDKNPTCNPEISKKVSESLKEYLEENPRCGEKNPFYGKKHKTELIEHWKESKKGKFILTEEQYQRKLENQPCGENSHLWKGGTSFEPYSPDFNNKLKRKIKNRDNFICSVCEKETQKLAVHHIDYDKLNSNEKNLISLCYSCHSKTNINREHWEKFFEDIINKKYDNLTDEE